MAILQMRRCESCKHEFEVMLHRGAGLYTATDLEVEREEDLVCPACASEKFVVLIRGQTRPREVEHDAGYPRFDRGLGVMLESEAHRQRVCKERGLVPLDYKPADLSDGYKRQQREFHRKADEGEAYLTRLEEDPAFRATRLARDRGEMLDWRRGHTEREIEDFNRRRQG